ncbi:hypothetical protein [Azospirillum agricola]|uniref:hypothetical protein n=1 Tax=Azospirillum agricola TaxID=1720247 RepID=UPI000A0F161D|nr:hypothetical protein [Azospirillum agricola]SMH46301.1 hypothetical protein SAMN02982994_2376 [Azospirillum lipoferum]
MDSPKYHVGQIVYFAPPAVKHGAPDGPHRIERLLPPDGGRRQYGLRTAAAGRERVAHEDELSGRTVVEALAQRLYEAGNPTNVPWARRGRTVRDSWIREAFIHLSKDTVDR